MSDLQDETIEKSTNSFDTLIADNTIHRMDINTSHPWNSERLIYVENGTETDFIGSSKTTDNPAYYTLNASAGDKLEVATRERFRYVAGYTALFSSGWYIAQDLTDGQEVLIEYGNGQDSIRARYTPSTNYLELVKGGTVVESLEFSNDVPLTQPQVDEFELNFGAGGEHKHTKSYIEQQDSNGDYYQQNENNRSIGNDSAASTDNFNLRGRVVIDCSNSNTAATMNILPQQYRVLGNAQPYFRNKSVVEFGLGGDIDDTSWTPVYATRLKDGFGNINVEVQEIEIFPSARMEVIAVAVDPSNTDASGWGTPDELTAENTAIETTESVTTPTTPTGRQTGLVVSDGAASGRGQFSSQIVETPVYQNDVLVFLARTKSGSGHTVDLVFRDFEEW